MTLFKFAQFVFFMLCVHPVVQAEGIARATLKDIEHNLAHLVV